MWVVAQVSFSGRVSMHGGEVRDIMSGEVLDDLLAAGYVVPQETQAAKQPTLIQPSDPVHKVTPPKTTRSTAKSLAKDKRRAAK